MSPEVIIALIMVCLSGFSLSVAVARLRAWTMIRSLHVTPISSLENGSAIIKGRILSTIDNLVSPLSGRPCAYFRFQIFDRIIRKIIHRRVSKVPLILDDGTGHARIMLKGATVSLHSGKSFATGFMASGLPTAVRQYLEMVGIWQRIVGFLRDLICEETVLSPGDVIYVLGYCSRLDDKVYFFKGQNAPYILSDRREKIMARKYLQTGALSGAAGAYLLLMGFLLCFPEKIIAYLFIICGLSLSFFAQTKNYL